jgi:hypothetical protein
MYDLKMGILDDPRIYGHYGDAIVQAICQPYEYLLDFDPTQEEHAQDERYVSIHPHNANGVVGLNAYHYKFVGRVIQVYLHNKVSLSHFALINS